jgi:glycosyltransferase involved in cell wall biosynthesis
MGSQILLSIALVTRNRPQSLSKCLDSVRCQAVQPFEIVVSDDSEPEYSASTREIAVKHGCRYLPGPGRGLYSNRNFVAQHCRGTHIRTMDDDHILPPDHLMKCYEAMAHDPMAIWTTGEIGYVNGEFVAATERASQLHPSGVGGPIRKPDDNWGISDGSTIYPSDIYARGFRMIEDFQFGMGYLEFGALLYANGWKCRCIPQALVEHYATSLSAPDPLSILFASVCYNQHFQPNSARLIRYLAPHWRSWKAMPRIFERARRRWEKSPGA